MNKLTKTASAMFLTAALWTGISTSHALLTRAASLEGTQTVSGSDLSPAVDETASEVSVEPETETAAETDAEPSPADDVKNVVSDEVYEKTYLATSETTTTRLEITKQPANYSGAVGSQVKFSVRATGSGLSYLWQLSDDGANWRNSSVKTADYYTTLSEKNNGRSVRCVVTDENGSSLTSDTATMTVKGSVAITGQPVDAGGASGSEVSFTVKAVGSGLSYLWQLSDDNGATWRDSSVTTSSYAATLTAASHGRRVRCVVTDSSGASVTSQSAMMTVNGLLAVISQPVDYSGAAGSKANFSVTATGSGLSYQWQLSDDGINWRNSSVKTVAYSATLSTTNHGRSVRCVVTDASGESVTSQPATMTIQGLLAITNQPADYTGAAGDAVTFKVTATGSGLTYQWQVSDDGGATWRDSATGSASYAQTLGTDNNGRLVRCVVTDGSGKRVTSRNASLFIRGYLVITGQPADYSGDVGDQMTFRVKAQGVGLSYQWQLSDDNGATWRNSSTKTASYATKLSETNNNRLVRCIVTSAEGKSLTSNAAKMKINTVFRIVEQPSTYIGSVGDQLTFTVSAEGYGLQYQWQLSDDGGLNWRNSSTKAAVYTTKLSETNNKRFVRCIVTNGDGSTITSAAGQMKLLPMFHMLTQPTDYVGNVGDKVTFEAAAAGYGLQYQWQLSDNNGGTWRNSSTKTTVYTTTLGQLNNNRCVRCVITDLDGDVLISDMARMTVKAPITILEQPENYIGKEGESVEFRVKAGADGALSYLWQLSDDSGANWRASSGRESSYWVTVSEKTNGRFFRCFISDGSGHELTSGTAILGMSEYYAPGFVTRNGVTKYRYSDGSYAEGLTTVGGNLYYFRSNVMRTGFFALDDKYYYFDEQTGAAITGLKYVPAHGKYYYFQGAEGVAKGFRTDSDGIRYFSPTTGTMQFGFKTIEGKYYHFNEETGLLSNGWFENVDSASGKTNVYYFRGLDGAATGLCEIDGSLYYFNDYGIRRKGFYEVDGVAYYFDPAAVTGIRYVDSHGKYYYFQGRDGVAKGFHTDGEGIRYFNPSTGTMQVGTKTIDGKYYYFDTKTGLLRTGWFSSYDDATGGINTFYFRGIDGAAIGLQEIDGDWYYFNEYGVARTGRMKIDGAIYYFDDYSYAAVKGFHTIPYGDTYYFGEDGKAVAGWQTIDGEKYYFLDDCTLSRGLTNIGGKRYYFDFDSGRALHEDSLVWIGLNQLMYIKADGGYATGMADIYGKRYYFSPDNGIALSGIFEKDGKQYYFAPGSFEAVSGFVEYNWTTYYFGSDLAMVTGLQTIDGDLYYFSDKGELRSGRVTIDGSVYCFGDDNKALSGWYTYSDGSVYYFDKTTHKALTGKQYIKESGANYYFDDKGVLRTGLITDKSDTFGFDAEGQPIVGWYNNGGDVYYFSDAFGAYKGLKTIGGKLYDFSDAGILQTGYRKVGDKYYVFDANTGEAMTGFLCRFTNSGTFVCYGDPDTKALLTGKQTIDGKVYVFDDAGVMTTGSYTDADGRRYLLDGVTGAAFQGFVQNGDYVNYYGDDFVRVNGGVIEIDGNTYYFDDYGSLRTGATKLDGKYYIFDSATGAKMTGLTRNSRNGSVYALGTGGVVANSQYRYWGADYYTNDSGIVLTSGTKTLDGVMRYFDGNGERQYGLITYKNSSGTSFTFFFGKDKTVQTGAELNTIKAQLDSALSKDGWYTVGGEKYYVKNGAFVKGVVSIDGKLYGFSELTGALMTGFHKIGGSWRYLNGSGVVQTGFVTVDGDTRYFVGADGAMVTGVQTIGGKTYCFLENGQMVTGSVFARGTAYHAHAVGESAANVSAVIGWQENGDLKSYYDRGGSKVTGLAQIDGKFYCFDKGGTMTTGFRPIPGGMGYFGENGAMVKGFRTIGAYTYYFDTKSGLMQTGFVRVDGWLYYFNDSGELQTGFFSHNGRTYYANASGAVKTGFVTVDDKTYYFRGNGEQVFGRTYIDGKIYYFDPTTGARKLGFVKVGDRLHYYNDSSTGIVSGLKEIDGKTYLFSAGDGFAYKGYRSYEGGDYYFDEVTGESRSGIFSKPNGKEYYFLGNGKIGYGLQTVGGKEYYFYPTNGVKVDGLQSIGSKLYYFDAKNGMLKNQTVAIDGISFKLASDGTATVPGDTTEAKLLRAGLDYLGRPYKSELDGSDDILSCSGFVRQMYSAIGMDLEGSSYRQYFNLAKDNATFESINYAVPGDLVFYVSLDCGHGDECGFLGEIHHVAMYVGGGKIIEANRNDKYPELSCIMVQSYADSTSYFPYKIVRVLD